LIPEHKEVAEILKSGIEAIQEMKIKKISISIDGNLTARIGKNKDGIKVEVERKQKSEALA